MNIPFYQLLKMFSFCWKGTFLFFIKSTHKKQVKKQVCLAIKKINKIIKEYIIIGSNRVLLNNKKVSSFKPFSRRELLHKTLLLKQFRTIFQELSVYKSPLSPCINFIISFRNTR